MQTMLAISDAGWNAIIAGCFAIVLEFMRRTTTKKLDKIVETGEKTLVTGEKTHTLVNSNMGVQLRLNAGNARRVATYSKLAGSPTSSIDAEAATLAEKLLYEHDNRQSKVDRADLETLRTPASTAPTSE